MSVSAGPTAISVPPAPSAGDNAAIPPTSKPDEVLHPPLEEFVCHPPALRFVDLRKLAHASQDVIAYQKALQGYRPTDYLAGVNPHVTVDMDQEVDIPEPSSPTESTDLVSSSLIEQKPCFAPPLEIQELPDDEGFQELMRRHEIERQNMAYDFTKEQSQVLSNYYDAQTRENAQKNEMIDRRPISSALRHISKRISYPVDYGVQRFYKYTFRCEKLTKKFKKSLTKMAQNHDLRADVLYHKQLQEIQAYGDINHMDLSEVKIPKLVTPVAPESN